MREEIVENGLRFLHHPSVQSTPLSERVSFLEGKGMTKEEIQKAIERYQNGETGAASTAEAANYPTPQQQLPAVPMMMNAVSSMPRGMRYPAYVRVLWTLSSLIGAASILTFLWNYAVQSGYIPWLRPMPQLLEASRIQKEKEEENKKDEALLAELSSVSAAIQQQTEELAKLSSSLDRKERDMHNKTFLSAEISSSIAEQSNAQSIAELKAEISTLKALLLSKKTEELRDLDVADDMKDEQDKSVVISHRKTASTPVKNVEQHPVAVPQVISKAERMQKALAKLQRENSLEQLKLAAGILNMYVKNLIEYPDVPRYRRIATGNANFKQKIEPLKHYEELLKSIGFETSGLNMEWKWHTSKKTDEFEENIAILRALQAALQSLLSPEAFSNLSLEEIAQASLDKFKTQQVKTSDDISTVGSMTGITTDEERSAGESSSVPSYSASTNLDAFMARLERQTSVNSVVNADVNGKNTLMSSFANNSGSEIKATGPVYPESFKEVMDIIQEGGTVPGIRDIEEKLSVDSNALLSDPVKTGEMTAVKPWEIMKA